MKTRTYLTSGAPLALALLYTLSTNLLLSAETAAHLVATGRAGKSQEPQRKCRVVTEAEVTQSDFIVHYWSDSISYMLKPASKDTTGGPSFYSIYPRPDVLKSAAEQPGRELAIVLLIHYPSLASEQPVKLTWANDLQSLGYKRIIFCRGDRKKVDRVLGLPVLDSPEVTELSATGQAGAQLVAGDSEQSLPVLARPGVSTSPRRQ
jgi:hypothetical protein